MKGTQLENKHGDPIFLLHFLMSCAWTSIVPSLTKMWIVHHFQGNYLKSGTYKFYPMELQTILLISEGWFRDGKVNVKSVPLIQD